MKENGTKISQQFHSNLREYKEEYIPSSDVETGYKHEAVNHSIGEYARGKCHVNKCENRASLLRLWLSIHRSICKDNLSLYLASHSKSIDTQEK